MGLKELKEQRKLIKGWVKELDNEGLDTSQIKTLSDITKFILKDLKDDDIKHNTMVTFLKNNQQLINDSVNNHNGFSSFIDNE